jgi:hypothetical protein
MRFDELDEIVLAALRDVQVFLRQSAWRGRENELVSLFAFGHLLRLGCRPKGPLEPTQIAIEVAVPQVSGWSSRQKAVVRKDLVVWRAPAMTAWTEAPIAQDPVLAVLEWTALNNVNGESLRTKKLRKYDLDVRWLSQATASRPSMSGYAILVDLVAPVTITCRLVRGGAEITPPQTIGNRQE